MIHPYWEAGGKRPEAPSAEIARFELPWAVVCIGAAVAIVAVGLGCFYLGLEIASQLFAFMGWGPL